MIKANEFRLGNLLHDQKDTVCKVKKIEHCEERQFYAPAISGSTTFLPNKPIPLTEEWLEKFGFEKYEFDHKENQYRYKYRLIVLRDGKFVDYGSSVIVEYVHQLQNLYFALTGEELETNN